MAKNTSIKCTVEQCKNHCKGENYCSLDCITVGTHELNPTKDECTDCKSFKLSWYWKIDLSIKKADFYYVFNKSPLIFFI